MEKWRLLDTGHLTAAENMALDDIILEAVANHLAPNTLRFLQFSPPAALVGYHQDIEHEIRLDYVKSKGIDFNRRITGGGALLFDEKVLGWEIVASRKSIPSYTNVEALFQLMCKGAIDALKEMGVQATYRPKNDIEVEGKKISGTGGVERKDAFLFQGTLLVDFDVEMMIKALRIPIAKLKDKELKSAKERVTWINRELERSPSVQEIKTAIKQSFEQLLNKKIEPDKLTIAEKNLFEKKLPYFKSEEWVYLDRRPLDEAAVVHSIAKTPGGLIRVSLAIDIGSNIIKSILVTGDFFVFPSKAILDFEAALKFTHCDAQEIRKTVYDFFSSKKVQLPGVTPEIILQLILQAIDKTSYESFGINLQEANHIYPVTKQYKELMQRGYDILLLPYCAKPVDCEYKWIEGCGRCGRCSVGQVYEWADELGIKDVLTIQNFEHLMSVLSEKKKEGAKGFIGCCCEAFYCKHQDELEEAGFPGIIIDIDDKTCYDLGKDHDAYKGNFDVQTQLKMDLLSKLLKGIKTKRTER